MANELISIHLDDLLDECGETFTNELLKTFSCPLNQDIENFLKENAIKFSQRKIAKTYLLFKRIEGMLQFVGYYTLTLRNVNFITDSLSQTKKKKILRNGTYSKDLKTIILPAPMIAQLGKNYQYKSHIKHIHGYELLQDACNKIDSVHYTIGGTTLHLECALNQKLIHFYEENGFFEYKRRTVDPAEISDEDNPNTLVQMAKIG